MMQALQPTKTGQIEQERQEKRLGYPMPFEDLKPVSKGKMTQSAQIKRLQRAIIAKAEEKKQTGNTLAQLARSWALLESVRLRLKGLADVRLNQAKTAQEKFAGVAPVSDPSEEAIMLDEDLADEESAEGLPIVIRKPPAPTEPGERP